MTITAYLPHRGVIEIEGPDRIAYLQGLVSNDVTKAGPGRAVWSALLTPQGRYLAEFFIFAADNQSLLIDAPRESIPDLIKRLSRYRLRNKVTLTDRGTDFAVHAAWNGPIAAHGAITAPDPRLPEAGTRILAPYVLPNAADGAEYLAHRISLGLPDHADLEAEKTLLLEAGFNELHGIDWDKGCYMGQELTARTRYRGLVKRRLIPISAVTTLPPSGAITTPDREAGELRTVLGTSGLAFLRLDCLDAPLQIGAIAVKPDLPYWLTIPAQTERANP